MMPYNAALNLAAQLADLEARKAGYPSASQAHMALQQPASGAKLLAKTTADPHYSKARKWLFKR
jgi:hypothetical protein